MISQDVSIEYFFYNKYTTYSCHLFLSSLTYIRENKGSRYGV